jgi:hypothetical protein
LTNSSSSTHLSADRRCSCAAPAAAPDWRASRLAHKPEQQQQQQCDRALAFESWLLCIPHGLQKLLSLQQQLQLLLLLLSASNKAACALCISNQRPDTAAMHHA